MAVDNYDTVNSRTILIPDLGLPFRAFSIKPENELWKALRALDPNLPGNSGGTELDELLEAEASSVFGVPSSQVTSFARWTRITGAIEATFVSDHFTREMRATYGGTDPDSQKRLDSWIDHNRTALGQWKNQFATVSAFSETLIRKGTLDPLRTNPEIATRFLDYSGEPTLLQSVYGDLAERGVLDTELINWQRTTSVLRPLHTTFLKEGFRSNPQL